MLMNARTAKVVAEQIEMADTRESRRKGLLGRDRLDASAALILRPCFSVHTVGMRFPIDVLFVDRDGVIVRVVRNLVPWRIAAAWGAHAVVEVAAGTAADVQRGDRLYLAAQCAPVGAAVSWPLPA
jgi:uncharacterized membrane protein (UPF0127 family)